MFQSNEQSGPVLYVAEKDAGKPATPVAVGEPPIDTPVDTNQPEAKTDTSPAKKTGT